jgi:hypothetical protein
VYGGDSGGVLFRSFALRFRVEDETEVLVSLVHCKLQLGGQAHSSCRRIRCASELGLNRLFTGAADSVRMDKKMDALPHGVVLSGPCAQLMCRKRPSEMQSRYFLGETPNCIGSLLAD